MEAAGVQALRHEWFVRPALDFKIDTGSVLLARVADRVECPQQRSRVRAAIRNVTWAICPTAAFCLKRDCLSEAVYDQMGAIAFHSERFQVLATNACAPWKR